MRAGPLIGGLQTSVPPRPLLRPLQQLAAGGGHGGGGGAGPLLDGLRRYEVAAVQRHAAGQGLPRSFLQVGTAAPPPYPQSCCVAAHLAAGARVCCILHAYNEVGLCRPSPAVSVCMLLTKLRPAGLQADLDFILPGERSMAEQLLGDAEVRGRQRRGGEGGRPRDGSRTDS